MSYEIVDHSYDVVIVGAGGAGLRAALCTVLFTPLSLPARDLVLDMVVVVFFEKIR